MADRTPKPISMPDKPKKVPVRMDKTVKERLPKQIVNDGYNMRQKSKWVAEAIVSLMSREGWESALVSEIVSEPDTQDVFTIPAEIDKRLNQEIGRIKMANPSMNPSKSTIIRCAIDRRLLGFYTKSSV